MNDKPCRCCEYLNNKKYPLGDIIIPLEGSWVLNHFSGDTRNILGRLVLATKNHYGQISSIPDYVAKYLGINLKRIESALIKYSSEPFNTDPITGIYVTYFNGTYPYHTHVHIFSITNKIFNRIADLKEATGRADNQNAKQLMEYLKKHYALIMGNEDRNNQNKIKPLVEGVDFYSG